MDIDVIAPVEFAGGPNGVNIAHRFLPGAGPTLVFLPGYMSDMDGGKAQAVLGWAHEAGRACLLLDYSGCGRSAGVFADGTLSRWRDEVVAVVQAKVLSDVVLCGSSMGGWLMLLVAEALGDAVAALVGIAPAPDFTDWGFTADQKAVLAAGETLFEDNPYGPEPTPTYPGFWADGQRLLRLEAGIAFEGPVRILQGQRDPDVPWQTALRMAKALRSDDVQVSLVKDGDHRLSRTQDVALLLRTIAALSTGA